MAKIPKQRILNALKDAPEGLSKQALCNLLNVKNDSLERPLAQLLKIGQIRQKDGLICIDEMYIVEMAILKKLEKGDFTSPQLQDKLAKLKKIKEIKGFDSSCMTIAISELDDKNLITFDSGIPIYRPNVPQRELECIMPIWRLTSRNIKP